MPKLLAPTRFPSDCNKEIASRNRKGNSKEPLRFFCQGAEAKIILSNNFIIKDRIKKSYRIPELDIKIRKRRTKSEAKLLQKASEIINSPKPFFKPEVSYQIKMPFIDGKKLSEHLDKFSLEKQKKICKEIGNSIANLHEQDIIHGDLTTSNMILQEEKSARFPSDCNKGIASRNRKGNSKEPLRFFCFFIDFGLGFISRKIEDKAVDLHLLKQALEAKHFKHWEVLFQEIKNSYKKYKEVEKVLNQLIKVEKRGRYKH